MTESLNIFLRPTPPAPLPQLTFDQFYFKDDLFGITKRIILTPILIIFAISPIPDMLSGGLKAKSAFSPSKFKESLKKKIILRDQIDPSNAPSNPGPLPIKVVL